MFRYSNVVATIALFVAMGGVSYAVIAVPRNSVGSHQVRNHSLRKVDVKRRHVKLRVLVKPTKAHVVDVDPAGHTQGDVLVSVSDVLSRSGRTIGENQAYCLEIEPGGFGPELQGGSATCTETFALRRGELQLVGTTGAGSGAGVIVGGTGAYAKATGTVVPGRQPVNGAVPNTLRFDVPR